jgi:hypothetical protein
MTVWPDRFPSHPAPFSDCILAVIDEFGANRERVDHEDIVVLRRTRR